MSFSILLSAPEGILDHHYQTAISDLFALAQKFASDVKLYKCLVRIGYTGHT